jgi:hypothetical protein
MIEISDEMLGLEYASKSKEIQHIKKFDSFKPNQSDRENEVNNNNNNKKCVTPVRAIYAPENIMQHKEHNSKKKEGEMRGK